MALPLPVRRVVAVVALLALVVALVQLARPHGELGGLVDSIETAPPTRDLGPYEGLGTWVDAFDYGPAYQARGHEPTVTPDDVDAMADAGVRTLFIQATRDDPRSPDGFVDEALLEQFVVRAHERDLQVVGWYLPTFAHLNADLGHLTDLLAFEVDGQRLDGVAVDIEFTEAVPDPDLRNRRLVRLSHRLREAAGAEPIGAIVLPPVLTEVVNRDLWPGFPWRTIEPLYDIWLPMSYWTLRDAGSGYRNGAAYHHESVVRLRTDLGDPDALVHGIGGIGDEVTDDDLRAFVATLAREGAVGGSVYDWATLSAEDRTVLYEAFTDWPTG
jgi:hypothetical protein